MATIVTSDVVLQDIDMGYDEIKRNLGTLRGVRIETGLFGAEAIKGIRNELGTEDIPARPWLSVAADSEKNTLASLMADAVDAVANGSPPKVEFDDVGEEAARLTRAVLGTSRVGGPALSPTTIAIKGHGRKLVDSGDMQKAVTSKVTVRR